MFIGAILSYFFGRSSNRDEMATRIQKTYRRHRRRERAARTLQKYIRDHLKAS